MSRRRMIELTVNGRPERVEIDETWVLVQLLRDGLRLHGTQEGCGEGSCGSCTVLIDGELARSCLVLAVRCTGREVTTIEGLGDDGLDPIQQAFVECGAVQCGFCTPGFILTTKALLAERADPSEAEIREHLAGNFCRCGGYTFIIEAVRRAAALLATDGS